MRSARRLEVSRNPFSSLPQSLSCSEVRRRSALSLARRASSYAVIWFAVGRSDSLAFWANAGAATNDPSTASVATINSGVFMDSSCPTLTRSGAFVSVHPRNETSRRGGGCGGSLVGGGHEYFLPLNSQDFSSIVGVAAPAPARAVAIVPAAVPAAATAVAVAHGKSIGAEGLAAAAAHQRRETALLPLVEAVVERARGVGEFLEVGSALGERLGDAAEAGNRVDFALLAVAPPGDEAVGGALGRVAHDGLHRRPVLLLLGR